MSHTQKELFCNFCAKSNREMKAFVAGPDVFICNECVESCGEPDSAMQKIPSDVNSHCHFCETDKEEIEALFTNSQSTSRICNKCLLVCDDVLWKNGASQKKKKLTVLFIDDVFIQVFLKSPAQVSVLCAESNSTIHLPLSQIFPDGKEEMSEEKIKKLLKGKMVLCWPKIGSMAGFLPKAVSDSYAEKISNGAKAEVLYNQLSDMGFLPDMVLSKPPEKRENHKWLEQQGYAEFIQQK